MNPHNQPQSGYPGYQQPGYPPQVPAYPQQVYPQQTYPPQQAYPPQPYPQPTYPPQQAYPAQVAQQYPTQYAKPTPAPAPPLNVQKPSMINGAFGDGVHDDTAALQSAFQKATPGSEFFLPPGNYRITAPLIVDKPISIIGDSTLICSFPKALWKGEARCDNGDTWKQHLFVVRASGVSISGIRFANSTNIEGVAGILVEGNDFLFTNCIVSDFYQGLMLGKLKSPHIPPVTNRNINIKNNQFLNIRGVPGGSIAYGDGILFFGCEDVVIDGNFLSAAPGRTPRNGINSGPEGFTQSTRVNVTNNRVMGDWDYPITTEGGRQCIVANNTIEGCCIAGIIERGQEITVKDNMIKVIGGRQHGCTCGIEFYGVDNGFIEKNIVTGSAKHGIICIPSHETKASTNIIIRDNSIEGDFFHSIYVGNSNMTQVLHNRVINTHKENGCMGICGWYTSALHCRDNDIQATNGTGCIFTGSSDVNMSGNIFTDTRAGLYVAKECKDVKVMENDFSGCKQTKHDACPGLPGLVLGANTM